jgi:hypothetical protein
VQQHKISASRSKERIVISRKASGINVNKPSNN